LAKRLANDNVENDTGNKKWRAGENMDRKAYGAARPRMVAAIGGEAPLDLRLFPELHKKSSVSLNGVRRGRMEARGVVASLKLVRLPNPANSESPVGMIAGRNFDCTDVNALPVRQLSEVF
jgi:hypothetical protein